jgi:hypothetical protein
LVGAGQQQVQLDLGIFLAQGKRTLGRQGIKAQRPARIKMQAAHLHQRTQGGIYMRGQVWQERRINMAVAGKAAAGRFHGRSFHENR